MQYFHLFYSKNAVDGFDVIGYCVLYYASTVIPKGIALGFMKIDDFGNCFIEDT